MSWLKNSIAQVNRIFGTNTVQEDASEAEFIDALEGLPTVADISQNSERLEGILERLGPLEEFVAKMTSEDGYDAFVASVSSFKESTRAELNKLNSFATSESLETMKSEFTKELNAIKAVSSGPSAPLNNSPQTSTAKPEEKTEDNVIQLNFSDFMLNPAASK